MKGNNVHVSINDGSDTPDCGSTNTPCQTIQYSLDMIAVDGDTILIESGTYQLPAGTPALTPVVNIPQGMSVTFVGINHNGPVRIDGSQRHRGFLYKYYGGGCPDTQENDGIDEIVNLAFHHLEITNCQIDGIECGNTTQSEGGGMNLWNNEGSNLNVFVSHCLFAANFAFDLDGPDNNARSARGGAIFLRGRGLNTNPNSSVTTIDIDSCNFFNNACNQSANGGNGGAINLTNVTSSSITNSLFCSNQVSSAEADEGDLEFGRNGGGAICYYDPSDLLPGNTHLIDNCYFINNHAITQGGANYPFQSAGGAIFLRGRDEPNPTNFSQLTIGNSEFYTNYQELAIEHVANNTGDIDLNSVGNNIFSDEFNMDIQADTLLCAGDTIQIGRSIPEALYEWSTGSTSALLTITEPGLYIITVTLGECPATDSILVSPCSNCPYTEEIQTICEGDTILLFNTPVTTSGTYTASYPLDANCDSTHAIQLIVHDRPAIEFEYAEPCSEGQTGSITAIATGGNPPYNYIWPFSGITGSALVGISPGSYQLQVTDNMGCQQSQTAILTNFNEPEITLQTSGVSCGEDADGRLLLSTYSTDLNYSLDGENFQDTPLFQNLRAGNYEVYIQTPAGCTITREFTISDRKVLQLGNRGSISLLLGDSIRIQMPLNNPEQYSYQWSPEDGLNCTTCPDVIARPLNSTRYEVAITDSLGCIINASLLVEIDETQTVYIPNAFSPNNDGINDLFTVFTRENALAALPDIKIFDRWGGLLWEQEGIIPEQEGWDGTQKDSPLPTGAYTYLVRIPFINDRVLFFTGTVQLIR